MESVDAKGIIKFALLLMVVLQFSSLVRAVDILVFETAFCSGVSLGCYEHPADKCCYSSLSSSVLFNNAPSCFGTQLYNSGQCKNIVSTTGGQVCTDCTLWSGCTGARWFDTCGQPALEASHSKNETSECETPNGLSYTEDGKGHWEMRSSNATELYMELKNVPEEERVQWFSSHGATYSAIGTGA